MRIDHTSPVTKPLAVLVACSALLAACTSTAPLVRGFGPDLTAPVAPGSADEAWSLWLEDGDTEAAHGAFLARVDSGATDPSTLFGRAETARATARYTEAVASYATLLASHPGHPVAEAAAMRMWSLRDHAPGWRDHADGLGAGKASPLTRGMLGRMALDVAWRRSRAAEDAPLFDGGPHGFPARWRVAGPMSVFPHLDRNSAFPADDDDALADKYMRRGFEEKTVDLVCDEPRCDPPFRKTGIHLIETWLDLPAPQDVVLVLETRHDAIVEVDSEPVFNVDRRAGDTCVLHARSLSLGAGSHRVRVRMAVQSQSDQFFLQFVTRGGEPFPGTFSDRPSNAARGSVSIGDEDLFSAALDEPVTDGWTAWVQSILAAEVGDVGLLTARSDVAMTEFPRFSGAPIDRAAGLAYALGLDRGVSREGALALLRGAIDSDGGALAAADRLGWMLAEDGRPEDALELLRPVAEARPTEYLVQLHLYQAFEVMGWTAEARRALRHAAKLNPSNCAVVTRLMGSWEADSIWPDPEMALTAEQRACDDAQRTVAMRYDLPQGRPADAIRRFEALRTRNPRSVETLRTLAELYELVGRVDDADKAWKDAVEISTDPVTIELARFDVLLGRGRRERALTLAQDALTRTPGSYGLLRATASLDGKSVLEDMRIDGRPIIAEFQKAPVGDAASGVYVLDYAATRVFEDGSSATNTHIIIRVQNKDGIDAFGEVEIPSTALLLLVRTVKPDGTTLEPDFVAGKDSISMPNLEPGDFVEYEYLEASEGSTLRKGSYEGIRFYFNIFDAPLLRSEYILDVPAAWTLEVDRRAGAPRAVVTQQGRFTRHRFLVERGPQVYGEPAAAPSGEFLPSIRASAARDQMDVHRTWRDQVLGSTQPNWLMREAVTNALRGAKTQRERAERLWGLVFTEVTGDESGVFARTAAETWSLGRGDRRVVLQTLFELGGIESEMVFARSWSADNTPSDVLTTDSLQWVLLRARIDDEWVWLDPSLNHAIFGYVPAAIQGNIGMRLGPVENAADLLVDLPTLPSQTDRRVIDLDLEVLPDGSVRGAVQETYNGEGAITFRRVLDSYTDRNELEQAVEQAMAQTFPGVDITDLEFANIDDANAPLLMRYTVAAPDFAVPGGRGLRIDHLFFASELTASYAQLPARRMTMVLGDRVRIDISLNLTLPEGTTLAVLPGPIDLSSKFGRIERSVALDARTVTWTRSFVLEAPRVAVSDYPAFQEFARVCDTADSLRLEVVPK